MLLVSFRQSRVISLTICHLTLVVFHRVGEKYRLKEKIINESNNSEIS